MNWLVKTLTLFVILFSVDNMIVDTIFGKFNVTVNAEPVCASSGCKDEVVKDFYAVSLQYNNLTSDPNWINWPGQSINLGNSNDHRLDATLCNLINSSQFYVTPGSHGWYYRGPVLQPIHQSFLLLQSSTLFLEKIENFACCGGDVDYWATSQSYAQITTMPYCQSATSGRCIDFMNINPYQVVIGFFDTADSYVIAIGFNDTSRHMDQNLNYKFNGSFIATRKDGTYFLSNTCIEQLYTPRYFPLTETPSIDSFAKARIYNVKNEIVVQVDNWNKDHVENCLISNAKYHDEKKFNDSINHYQIPLYFLQTPCTIKVSCISSYSVYTEMSFKWDSSDISVEDFCNYKTYNSLIDIRNNWDCTSVEQRAAYTVAIIFIVIACVIGAPFAFIIILFIYDLLIDLVKFAFFNCLSCFGCVSDTRLFGYGRSSIFGFYTYLWSKITYRLYREQQLPVLSPKPNRAVSTDFDLAEDQDESERIRERLRANAHPGKGNKTFVMMAFCAIIAMSSACDTSLLAKVTVSKSTDYGQTKTLSLNAAFDLTFNYVGHENCISATDPTNKNVIIGSLKATAVNEVVPFIIKGFYDHPAHAVFKGNYYVCGDREHGDYSDCTNFNSEYSGKSAINYPSWVHISTPVTFDSYLSLKCEASDWNLSDQFCLKQGNNYLYYDVVPDKRTNANVQFVGNGKSNYVIDFEATGIFSTIFNSSRFTHVISAFTNSKGKAIFKTTADFTRLTPNLDNKAIVRDATDTNIMYLTSASQLGYPTRGTIGEAQINYNTAYGSEGKLFIDDSAVSISSSKSQYNFVDNLQTDYKSFVTSDMVLPQTIDGLRIVQTKSLQVSKFSESSLVLNPNVFAVGVATSMKPIIMQIITDQPIDLQITVTEVCPVCKVQSVAGTFSSDLAFKIKILAKSKCSAGSIAIESSKPNDVQLLTQNINLELNEKEYEISALSSTSRVDFDMIFTSAIGTKTTIAVKGLLSAPIVAPKDQGGSSANKTNLTDGNIEISSPLSFFEFMRDVFSFKWDSPYKPLTFFGIILAGLLIAYVSWHILTIMLKSQFKAKES